MLIKYLNLLSAKENEKNKKNKIFENMYVKFSSSLIAVVTQAEPVQAIWWSEPVSF